MPVCGQRMPMAQRHPGVVMMNKDAKIVTPPQAPMLTPWLAELKALRLAIHAGVLPLHARAPGQHHCSAPTLWPSVLLPRVHAGEGHPLLPGSCAWLLCSPAQAAITEQAGSSAAASCEPSGGLPSHHPFLRRRPRPLTSPQRWPLGLRCGSCSSSASRTGTASPCWCPGA